MRKWTLERAKNAFSEVVRRALKGEVQVVERGGRMDEAVVVISREEYNRLTRVRPLLEFFQDSPLAEAIAAGDFGDPETAEPFPRNQDAPRDVELE